MNPHFATLRIAGRELGVFDDWMHPDFADYNLRQRVHQVGFEVHPAPPEYPLHIQQKVEAGQLVSIPLLAGLNVRVFGAFIGVDPSGEKLRWHIDSIVHAGEDCGGPHLVNFGHGQTGGGAAVCIRKCIDRARSRFGLASENIPGVWELLLKYGTIERQQIPQWTSCSGLMELSDSAFAAAV